MSVYILDEADVVEKLKILEQDPGMKTETIYSPSANSWPDNRLTFTERHLVYLRAHKNVNPDHYISNLTLMIKKR